MRFVFLYAALSVYAAAADDTFLVKPYLQLGDSPSRADRMALLWHTGDTDENFSVEVRMNGSKSWKKMAQPSFTRVVVRTIEPHRVWSANLEKLRAGEQFEYRVLKARRPVFEARGRARKLPEQPYRFAVFGDCGQNSPEQKGIAFQTWNAKPDMVFITGDIVYGRGRISEYRPKHFPIYNADEPSSNAGVPLLRSVLFVGAPGNHDIATTDLETNPDALAYFFYWKQPLNGPSAKVFRPAALRGPDTDVKAFLAAAGPQYPRMANFSFDYGNAHWTVIDSNPYVDWRDPELRRWVADDLRAARKAAWRFVGFHHPGFNSSKAHFSEQQMRLLSSAFEEGGVDVVFSGHVHNYQRSFPMRFESTHPSSQPAKGPVAGEWRLDKEFDGESKTRPNGVIYIVTGAGGARLYNPEQHDAPDSWQPFTARFISNKHSVTVADINGNRLMLRQVGIDGEEVDRISIVKQ